MRRRKGNFDIFSHFSCFVPGAADIFLLLFWFLAGSLLAGLATGIVNLICGGALSNDITMLISYPLSFIPAMIYASSASTRRRFNELEPQEVPLDDGHFGSRGGLMCALVAVATTFSVAYVSEPFTMMLPDMPSWLEEALESMTGGSLAANLVCVAVFAPFFEEWFCRGMVLRGLLNHKRKDGSTMKPVWAIILSAVFFAVIHLNPWQAIPAFLVGVLMGYVYYRTGSLKLTMLMHCFNNASAVLMAHSDKFAEADGWADILMPQAYWTLFVCCIIITVLAALFYKESC